MAQYIVRRLLLSAVILLLISMLSFLLMHSSPGNFINPLEYPGELGQEEINQILHNMGLDRPWYVQYGDWLGDLLHADLGRSYKYNEPVSRMILERLPATLELTITALVLSLVFGVVVGVLSAVNRGGTFDSIARVVSVAGHAVPGFWLGLVCVWLFSVRLGWLPATGRQTTGSSGLDVVDRIEHLILPASILAFGLGANFSRYMRGEMLDVLHQDYVRTARAKGLASRTVLIRHAFRNALIPLITILGLNLRFLFGGAVLIESVFAWPGMGRLIVNAAFQRDYPVIMGATIIGATLVILGNLLADIAYAWADPRIKFR